MDATARPDRPIRGAISATNLKTELGSAAAAAAIKLCKKNSHDEQLIPASESLRVGDVILSRPLDKKNTPRRSIVEEVQLLHDCEPESAYWSHSMLYAGQLHVIESQKDMTFRTGVQVNPLTKYSPNHDLKVLRYNHEEFTQDRRLRIVRYALLDHAIRPRKYPRRGSLEAFYKWRPNGASHITRINCSEFILECFAIAAEFLVKQYLMVLRDQHQFYLPAHIDQDENFVPEELEYYVLED